jgi:hypothetical protein
MKALVVALSLGLLAQSTDCVYNLEQALGRRRVELLLLVAAGIGGLSALLASGQPLPSEGDFKKAQDKLKLSPDDPDANTVVGKYLCFVLGNYDDGMVYLSKSQDKTLRTLAEHERAPGYTDTASKRVGMGDEWVAASKSFAALHKIFVSRATYWYGLAWADMKNEPAWGDKLRERFRKIYLVNAGVPPPKNLTCPSGWRCPIPDARASRSQAAAAFGQSSFAISCWKSPLPSYAPIDQTVDVRPGPYKVSAWILTDGTDQKDGFMVSVQNSTGVNIILRPIPVNVDEPWWKRVDLDLDVPADGVKLGVGFGVSSKQGMIYLDAFSVKGQDGKELLKNSSFEDR